MDTTHTLASLRARAGMTAESAAAALGVSRPTLASYEADSSRMPAEKLAAAAELYAVPLAAIYIGDSRKLAAAIRASAQAAPANTPNV